MKSLVKFALVLLFLAATQAEVRVHHIFGSNMVLQRDKPVRVWGYAGVDEPVSVEFAGQRRSTTGGDDGRWVVKLSSMPASAEPRTFTVKGRTNTVVCEQVLVGDVWILGGQSNMEFSLDKIELGERIARWALTTQHGFKLPWEPALCVGVETNGNRLVLTFNQGLATHDDRPPEGFAIAGPDRHFYPAKAEFILIGKDDRGQNRYDQKKIQVASDLVPEPVAARYAWARNPLGNLVSGGHGPKYILPAPAFRTDHWDWPDAPFVAANAAEASRLNRQNRQQAAEWARQRQRAEAELILKAEKKPNPK